ncbi:MAG: VanZ family protein, partial [Clostridiales bacterium]|nr:VanZ family protein [Clostridiales bacterium]
MNKTLFKSLSVIFYLASLFFLMLFLITGLTPDSWLNGGGALLLLPLFAAALLPGSRFLALTLEKERRDRLMKMTAWFFFAAYLFLLIMLLFFGGRRSGNIFLLSGDELRAYLQGAVNIIPFKEIREYIAHFFNQSMNTQIIVINIFGNLAAFTPFALFLPLLTKIKTGLKFFLTMLGLVV